MQFTQPFCGTGYPNYIPFCPYSYSRQYQTIYPEVIGEGEVASVVFPDGSFHFYFLPLNKQLPNVQCKPNYPNYNRYWNNSVGAYYIRSISNPITPTVFTQQCQNIFGTPNSRPCLFPDCNSVIAPSFELKFHNDCWTSTTDLHYFFPCLRGSNWFSAIQSKACEAMQTDFPKEDSTYRQITCPKPCLCFSPNQKESIRCSEIEMVDDCLCKINNDSKTSVSSSRSTKSKTKLHKRKNTLKLKRHKQRRVEKKTTNVDCECYKPSTIDKSVTTYTDQASCCHAEERNTQTCPSSNSGTFSVGSKINNVKSRAGIKSERFPEAPKNRKMKMASSENIIGIYETDCSSESCCCSANDTDKTQ